MDETHRPWLARLRQRLRPGGNTQLARLRRRTALATLIDRRLSSIVLGLFFAGYAWMIALPNPLLSRGTYFDENALQPAQVNTYWNWGEVHQADRYLEQLELLRDNNATSEQRAEYLVTEFRKLGLESSKQNYRFTSQSQNFEGVNAYSVLSSPRASGTEAMVISASWISRTGEGNGTLNLRGISTVLALAKFLKQFSFWAKDIIFIVSDGYMDGMQAWLAEYHAASQQNLVADRITIPSGVIWTALNIDYPGHSFSHLGIFHEGLNGRLPNQDLVNSFQSISRWAGIPVLLYDHLDPRDYPGRNEAQILPDWVPTLISGNDNVQAYSYHARNVLRHILYQASGHGSGVHGLFHQYRIDAFTVFAVPATGPHGFHAIGRVTESTLRTCNNLLERLHASFFFYILTGPARFVKIGNFLPSAVLISVAMMFRGLKLWNDAGWTTREELDEKSHEIVWVRRKRPVLTTLAVMVSIHFTGVCLFLFLTCRWFTATTAAFVFAVAFALLPVLAKFSPILRGTPLLSNVLQAFNLCSASAVISATTVLNFSLAVCLAVMLGVPLSLQRSNGALRLMQYSLYMVLAFGWLFAQKHVSQSVTDWRLFGVWFTPFMCMIYSPLVLQSALVCLINAE